MKTPENKRRAAIGRELLSHLRPIRSLREVGKIMGTTGQNISLIEEQAAYKIVMALQPELKEEKCTLS